MIKLYIAWALIVVGLYCYSGVRGVYFTSIFEPKSWSRSGPSTFHHK